jgi:GDPmannose 4,6-dehydratase
VTTALIYGIGGQDGSYLTELLLSMGYDVHGVVRRQSVVQNQMSRLDHVIDRVTTYYGDVNDPASCLRIVDKVKPAEVYNLAAQSHVRISFDEPHYTFQTNAVGALNVFEACRYFNKDIRVYQASSIAYDTPVLVQLTGGAIVRVRARDTFALGQFAILSHNPSTNKPEFKQAASVIAHGQKQTYRLRTQGKGTLKVTAEHSVFVWGADGIYAKRTDECAVGDYLVTLCDEVPIWEQDYIVAGWDISHHIPSRWHGTHRFDKRHKTRTFSVTEGLARVLGYYLAEGHCDTKHRRHRVAFTFGNHERGIAAREDCKKILQSIFHKEPRETERHTSTIVTLCGKEPAALFSMLGCTARTKRLPHFVWKWSRPLVIEFLRGYSQDAAIWPNGTVVFTTVNEDLHLDCLYLCRMKGIPCKRFSRIINDRKAPQGGMIKGGVAYDMYVPSGQLFGVRPKGSRTPAELCMPSSIAISESSASKTVTSLWSYKAAVGHATFIKHCKKPSPHQGLGVAKITAIEKGLIEPVLDFVVPGCERFFCGDLPVLAHNSSEMFGNSMDADGFQRETTPMRPVSPYGIAKLAAYNFAHYYRNLGMFVCNGILFNHSCFVAGTPMIVKRNGLLDCVPICELIPNPGHKPQRELDFDIWGNNQWTKALLGTARWNEAGRKTDRLIHRIHARSGEVSTTADHKFVMAEGREVEARSVVGKDQLLVTGFPNPPNVTVASDELAYFLGIMAAEGYVGYRDGKMTARCANTNGDILRHVGNLWQRLFCGTSGIRSRTRDKHTEDWIDLTGCPSILPWLYAILYTRDGQKRVPSLILNANHRAWKEYLRGYNDGDGLKAGGGTYEFKNFTTSSPVLAAALWWMANIALQQRLTLNLDRVFREGVEYYYYSINLNSPDVQGAKGAHLRKPNNEVKWNRQEDYTGWVYDIATESGTLHAGVGNLVVHNSPRRGWNFVEAKIVRGALRIKDDRQVQLRLGNLDACRDWGHSYDYVRAMHAMLQQDEPDDYVVATGITWSVRDVCEMVFFALGMDWNAHVKVDDRYRRPKELHVLKGDAGKVKDVLGWTPGYDFRGVLTESIEHHAKQMGVKL